MSVSGHAAGSWLRRYGAALQDRIAPLAGDEYYDEPESEHWPWWATLAIVASGGILAWVAVYEFCRFVLNIAGAL